MYLPLVASNFDLYHVLFLTVRWELWSKNTLFNTFMNTTTPGLLPEHTVPPPLFGNLLPWTQANWFAAIRPPGDTSEFLHSDPWILDNSSLKSSHNKSIFSSPIFLHPRPSCAVLGPCSTYEKLFLSLRLIDFSLELQLSPSSSSSFGDFLWVCLWGEGVEEVRRHKGGDPMKRGGGLVVVGKLKSSMVVAIALFSWSIRSSW